MLSKEDKIKILNIVLSNLESRLNGSKLYSPYICDNVRNSISIFITSSVDDIGKDILEQTIPEILIFKPKETYNNNIWFQPYSEGIKQRINIIRATICLIQKTNEQNILYIREKY